MNIAFLQTDVEKTYKLGKDLGTGNFAVVKLAVKRDTGDKFAIKIINKALCAGKEDMIETEIAVLKKVKHKYIVGMVEEFDTPDKLYLVLDLVTGGELFDRIVDEVSRPTMPALGWSKKLKISCNNRERNSEKISAYIGGVAHPSPFAPCVVCRATSQKQMPAESHVR